MNAKIQVIEQIGGHAATGFIIRSLPELLDQGLADETSRCADWDSKAVLALDPATDRIIGIIAFTEVKWLKELFVVHGYVLPAHRQKGVYRAMWAALVDVAQRGGWFTISGLTSTKNAEMRAVAAKLGRQEELINLKFNVPPAPKP